MPKWFDFLFTTFVEWICQEGEKMWSIDACLYSYHTNFSQVFFYLVFLSFLFLSSCFLLPILSHLLLLASPFYCSLLPPFIPSAIIEFNHFVPQPFLASYGHLFRIAHHPAGCPAITSTQSMLVASLSISRQSFLSCFLPLSILVLPLWIRIKLSHHLPLWHASSGTRPHIPLLGEMLS